MKAIVTILLLSCSTIIIQAQKIEAISTTNVTAVYGESKDGRGVFGKSTNGRGVHGKSDIAEGVFGKSTIGYGVHGESESSYGIFGYSKYQNGVHGHSGMAAAISGYTVHEVGVVSRSDSAKAIEAWGYTYDFDAIGDGIDYGSTSSRRWKHNIKNIPHPLEKLSKLRGVYFDWDADHGGRHDIGFIAEEVGEIIPEIVGYEENGIDATGMDYSRMTPLLVEATNAMRKEYLEKIAEQKSRIENLEQEIASLKQILSAKPQIPANTDH